MLEEAFSLFFSQSCLDSSDGFVLFLGAVAGVEVLDDASAVDFGFITNGSVATTRRNGITGSA